MQKPNFDHIPIGKFSAVIGKLAQLSLKEPKTVRVAAVPPLTLRKGPFMRALIHTDCIGCELCASVCPSVFAMRTDGTAEAVVDPVPLDQEECCRKAADECPVSAIAIRDGSFK